MTAPTQELQPLRNPTDLSTVKTHTLRPRADGYVHFEDIPEGWECVTTRPGGRVWALDMEVPGYWWRNWGTIHADGSMSGLIAKHPGYES
jgi:hypothetical protein